MANVIKHKRGSGSDPAANNLVLGELAIRTDNGKLFTKMDSGAIAEIAGGGSDIAINTLSSSSATGGGSATFNGSAYRFTLSSPPSVSAAQLLVSVNGVVQKPVAGTGQPSEGFSVSGNDIIFGDAPATGSDFFILTFRSLGVSEPADNSVTSAKIVDGAIVNADINASAAIAGTKISPDFGSQNITTTGDLLIDTNTLRVDSTNNRVGILTTGPNEALEVAGNCRLSSGGATRTLHMGPASAGIEYNVNGTTFIQGRTDAYPLAFKTQSAERMRIDSSGRLGIGTTNPLTRLQVEGSEDSLLFLKSSDGTAGLAVADNSGSINILNTGGNFRVLTGGDASAIGTNATEKFRITTAGKVGINETSPQQQLHVHEDTIYNGILINGNNAPRTAFARSTTTTGEWSIGIDGTNGNDFTINNSNNNSNRKFIIGGASSSNANKIISLVNHRFNGNVIISNSGSGIDFSATSDASGKTSELLSDYEEGTWTPTASGFTITTTYSARYTKIGRLVYVNCYLQSATGSGTSIQPVVGGLPYTSKGGNTLAYGAGRLGTGNHNNSASDIAYQVENSSTNVKIIVGGGGINEAMMSGGHVIFSLVYEVA